MNLQTSKNRFRKPFVILFCMTSIMLIVFFSCRKDFSNLHSERSNYSVEISYEEESISFNEYSVENPANLSILQQVSIVPVITRKRMSIGIMEDGSSVIEITKIKPKNQFAVKHETPPDPSAKVKTTKIFGGTALYFGENGSLLYSTPFKSNSFSDFITAVKNNKNKLTRQLFATYIDKNRLKSSANEIITHINDTLNSVTRVITAADGLPENMLGKTFENVVNTKTGEIFGNAIYDEAHNFIYRIIQTYSSNKDVLIPIYSKSETFGKTADGTDYVSVNIKEVEKYSFINNLN